MSLAAFELLGLEDVESFEDAVRVIRDGIGSDKIRTLAEHYHVSQESIAVLAGMSKATLTRKLREGRLLDAPEADRVYRLAKVFALARDVFENDDTASSWFGEPNRALEGKRPIELLDTDIGVARVETVLNQIEYGVIT